MRVDITDEVVAQLADVLTDAEIDDPVNWMAVQFAARDAGHDELATFVREADAATYFEALQRAGDRAGIDVRERRRSG